MAYFRGTKPLHTYGKFTLDGAMSSTLNTKSLQDVMGTDDAVYKLARSNYYKYVYVVRGVYELAQRSVVPTSCIKRAPLIKAVHT